MSRKLISGVSVRHSAANLAENRMISPSVFDTCMSTDDAMQSLIAQISYRLWFKQPAHNVAADPLPANGLEILPKVAFLQPISQQT